MDNRCVSCGTVISEGRLVCPNCEATVGTHTVGSYESINNRKMDKEKFKRILWKIICKENLLINNQNIDWLIDRVYKGGEQG